MWNQHLFMTRAQIREYDRIAMETLGMSGLVLMENAGRGAAHHIMARFAPPTPVGVIAGPGNNGGDGYVIARHLINHGYQVTTYRAHPREKVAGDARVNLELLEGMNGRIVPVDTDSALRRCPPGFSGEPVLVDALLGTGVTREVTGRLGALIDRMNACGAVRVAVDIPSGLDADTGRPMGRCVDADMTITFGHPKRGALLYPGACLCGDLRTVSIGVPGYVSEQAGVDGELLSEGGVAALLPGRPAESHKGTFGHLLIIGGLSGKTGAVCLAGNAAARVGTGLVTIATTGSAQPAVDAKCMETMSDHIVDSDAHPFDEAAGERLAFLLGKKQAVAVGPGLGTAPTARALLERLLETADLPVVLDADAINLLASSDALRAAVGSEAVLTPHPGEMARLMGTDVREVQSDRVGAARAVAASCRAVVVLKGAHTVVASPDGRVFINPTGNPGMASGGMGDVLTGVIGGLLAQGVSPLDAANAGVYLHGSAADKAVLRTGTAGLLASDVIRDIPAVMNLWAAHQEG